MRKIDFNLLNNLQLQNAIGSKITVVTHINPDGDAIGSLLGVFNFFKERNFDIIPVIPNAAPKNFADVPGFSEILVFENAKDEVKKRFMESDIIIITDFNSPKRVGDLESTLIEAPGIKIMIDHHPEPDPFAQYIYSDTSASSASEIVFEFLSHISGGAKLSKNAATCIYLGIMTDTGNFSYSSSHPETFRTVAELLECGIDKEGITAMVSNNYTEGRMRLMGFILYNKMQVRDRFNTGYITLSIKEKENFNFENGDAEGFVNWPLSIQKVNFSAIFMENEDYVKASFRSKGKFDTNVFARKHFNGGGHVNASGGKFYGSLKDAISLFEKLLRVYQKELNL